MLRAHARPQRLFNLISSILSYLSCPPQEAHEDAFGTVYAAEPFWVDSGVLLAKEVGDEAAELNASADDAADSADKAHAGGACQQG